MTYLQQLVVHRCNELGLDEAAKFFAVSPGLIKQWQSGSKTPSLAAVEQVFQQSFPVVGSDEKTGNWAGKEIFLAIPCYKTADPRMMFSMLGLWDKSKFGASVRYGDAFVAHTRELLLQDFLNTPLPECQMIDDDMIMPMGNGGWFNYHTGFNFPEEFAGVHGPSRLRSHGKTIVGALYFGRSPRGRAMYYEAMITTPEGDKEDRYAHTAPRDEIRPVWWCATGGLWFKREVLTDIQKTHPHLAPESSSEPFHFFMNADDCLVKCIAEVKQKVNAAAAALRDQKGAEAQRVLEDAIVQIMDAEQRNKKEHQLWQGEDQTFGKRAAVAGHQSYVDYGVVCAHAGGCLYGPHNTGQR